MHVLGILIGARSNEYGMAEPTFGSPLDKPDLHDQLWLDPLHLAHLIGGDAASPSVGSRVGKIHKRAARDVERLQLPEKLTTDMRYKTRLTLPANLRWVPS
jgi:hypothetical protein